MAHWLLADVGLEYIDWRVASSFGSILITIITHAKTVMVTVPENYCYITILLSCFTIIAIIITIFTVIR